MSAFRKYRLTLKLLDCYGIPSGPQKYVDIISEDLKSSGYDFESSLASRNNVTDEIISPLQSSNPSLAAKLYAVSKYLQILPNDMMMSEVPAQPIAPKNPMSNKILQFEEQRFEEMLPLAKDLNLEEMSYERPGNHQFSLPLDTIKDYCFEGQKDFIRISKFSNEFDWIANRFPASLQEFLVIEDALNLMHGISGKFILFDGDNGFLVDETLSSAIIDGLMQLLQASQSSKFLDAFCNRQWAGKVAQALCAFIRASLQDLHQIIVSIEKKFLLGSIGLQQVNFYLQPHFASINMLSCIARAIEVRNLNGGSIIKEIELHMNKMLGDRPLFTFLTRLFNHCSRPICSMLRSWLLTGLVNDPHGEFFVKSIANLLSVPHNVTGSQNSIASQSATNAYSTMASHETTTATTASHGANTLPENWVIIDENVTSSIADKASRLLLIGSYHELLRRDDKAHEISGIVDKNLGVKEICLSEKARMHTLIDRTYHDINQLLSSRLIETGRLQSLLRACKEVFFMGKADAFGSFLDETRLELRKTAGTVIWEDVHKSWDHHVGAALDSQFYGAFECFASELCLADQLQQIIGASDGSRSRGVVEKAGSATAIKGIDLFTLSAKFKFPDNLLLGADSISKYELLFRFLFRLFYQSQELYDLRPRNLSKSALLLCRQLVHFLENVHQYLIFDVLLPRWKVFMDNIEKVEGLEGLIQQHIAFLDACLRQSMLTNAKLMQILNLLLSLCSRFINLFLQPENEHGDFSTKISSISTSFTKTMQTFLEALQYYSSRDYDYHLGTMFTRLEFNSFYYSNGFASNHDVRIE